MHDHCSIKAPCRYKRVDLPPLHTVVSYVERITVTLKSL